MSILRLIIIALTAVGALAGVGASFMTGWLVLTQAPRTGFGGAHFDLSPGFEAAWKVVGASGKLEFLFGKEAVRIPLEIGAEALELFHEFDEREDRFLTHPQPLLRTYALFHALAQPRLPYERVVALLDDPTPLQLAHPEPELERASVGDVALTLLCRRAAEHEGVRLLLARLATDSSRLALRGVALACLASADAVADAREGQDSKFAASVVRSWHERLWQAVVGVLVLPTVTLRRSFFE